MLHVNVDMTFMPRGLDMRISYHRHTFMRLVACASAAPCFIYPTLIPNKF
jgi:hypothetical protein